MKNQWKMSKTPKMKKKSKILKKQQQQQQQRTQYAYAKRSSTKVRDETPRSLRRITTARSRDAVVSSAFL